MKPRHKEIFDTIRREILAGKYDADSNLPSESALAARFGCSRPTISRVTLDLKRDGLIATRKGAPSTITRYAINATGVLGLIMPGEGYAEIFNPIRTELSRLAELSGWDMVQGEIFGKDPKVMAREVRRIAYQFSTEHVAGVFLQPLEFIRDAESANEEIVSYFDRAGIAVVLLDYDILKPPRRSRYDVVGIDNFSAGLSIGRHFIRTGARRICFLHRPGAAETVSLRMAGVMAAVVQSGGTWSRENELMAEPENARAVSRFLKSSKPDAIVAGNDMAAVRLGETLRRIGGGAKKIRLAGFDDVAAAKDAGLTTAHQPIGDIASVALQALVSRIKSPKLPPRTILLDAPLVVR